MTNIISKSMFMLFSLILVFCLPIPANAATYLVNSTADPGDGVCDTTCTLRDAMLAANATVGVDDEIVFDRTVLGSGTITIQPTSILPSITDTVKIDGHIAENRGVLLAEGLTQRPGVVIDMSAVPPAFKALPFYANALTLRGPGASNSEIRGLVINGWAKFILLPNGIPTGTHDFCLFAFFNPDSSTAGAYPELEYCGVAIHIFGANNVKIAGNYFNLDADGEVLVGDGDVAIETIDSSNTMIGGTTVNDRNVLANGDVNRIFGLGGLVDIYLMGWSEVAFNGPKVANYNKVIGNYMGLSATGTPIEFITSRLVIYGDPPFLVNPVTRAVLMGSFNVADDSLSPLGVPGRWGWGAQCSESDKLIAGHCEMIGAEVRNNVSVLSGGGSINILGYHEDTNVENNKLYSTGDITWTPEALIEITNLQDIFFEHPEPAAAVNMVVRNNKLGGDENGPFGTPQGQGFRINAAESIRIEDNIITNSVAAGIFVGDLTYKGLSEPAHNIAITKNSIYGNGVGGLGFDECTQRGGINLDGLYGPGADCETLNDLMDPDDGANNLQNYPVLEKVYFNTALTFIEGSLNSTPNSLFRVEIFVNDVLTPIGHGEGKHYLTSRVVSTDANGDVYFQIPYNDNMEAALLDTDENGDGIIYLTATAIVKVCDPNGSVCKLGDTSEFSKVCEVNINTRETVNCSL